MKMGKTVSTYENKTDYYDNSTPLISRMHSCPQTKELVSVSYHRSGMRSDDCTDIRLKTADTYTLVYEKGRNEAIRLVLRLRKANLMSWQLLFSMSKPRKERRIYVRDLMESLQVSFIKTVKPIIIIIASINAKTKKLLNWRSGLSILCMIGLTSTKTIRNSL